MSLTRRQKNQLIYFAMSLPATYMLLGALGNVVGGLVGLGANIVLACVLWVPREEEEQG